MAYGAMQHAYKTYKGLFTSSRKVNFGLFNKFNVMYALTN